MRDAVVIGSGLAGLGAAGLLAKRGFTVTVVESSDSIGGLLGGRKSESGHFYDFGTHVLGDTGISELDEILNGPLDEVDGWNVFDACPSSTWFSGQLSDSGFVDTRSLPRDIYQKGMEELFSLPRCEGSFLNLQEELDVVFGMTFRKAIFEPILSKFMGKECADLAPGTHKLFGLNRIVVGSSKEAVEWKREDSWVDERIAFHDPRIGARPGRFLYPKSGGMHSWVTALTETLVNKWGVRFLTNTKVTELRIGSSGREFTVKLSNEEAFEPDQLVWAAPVFSLLKLVGSEIPRDVEPPQFCRTSLIDLELTKAPNIQTLYLNCFDPDMRLFRVTNYNALERKDANESGRVTVECIDPPSGRQREIPAPTAILNEMVRCEIFDENTEITSHENFVVESGFPVVTNRFLCSSVSLGECAASLSKNLHVVGRGSGKAFFMKDVLVDLHSKLSVL